MAGHAYVTQADPQLLKDVAFQTSGMLGFTVHDVAPRTLKVTMSSLAASIFLGAFVAYCDFTVNVISHPDGTRHLVLERNSPWWTGFLGVNRVKNKSIELANTFGNELIRRGVQILNRSDF